MDGTCEKALTCDEINCGDGYECVLGVCYEIILPPPPPECSVNADCPQGKKCVEEKCVLITCDNIKCPDYESCEYGICFRKYDYFCSRIQSQI